MQFITIVAAFLSMAAFGIAAPMPVAEGMYCLIPTSSMKGVLTYATDVVVRQNHGMCVSGTAGEVTQIDC
jgi:hypothetical protein